MNLKDLHDRGWIDRHKPFWWNINYAPDPRELISLEDFVSRIEILSVETNHSKRKISFPLYYGEKVPIILHKINLNGEDLDLFITARPYIEKEAKGLTWPLEKLKEEFIENEFAIFLYHFIPHVRGLLRGERNDTIFWNPIISDEAAISIHNKIQEIVPGMFVWLSSKGRYDIFAYNWYGKVGADSISSESPKHLTPYQELKKRKLISGKKHFNLPMIGLEEVAYDEFMQNLDSLDHMISVYPIRHPNLDETIPLVLATRTHSQSKRKAPTVLGVMGGYSHQENYRIWRINDKNFCKYISETLDKHFNVVFDVVYFKDGGYNLVSMNSL